MKHSWEHWFVAVFLAGTLAAGRTDAHHSIAATYFLDKEVVLHGVVAEFLLRNPHSFLMVDAPDDMGRVQQWSIEWSPAGVLGQHGIRGDTLRSGDDIEITIMLGKRPQDHRGLLKIIRRPSDGFEWGTKPGETIPEWGVRAGSGGTR